MFDSERRSATVLALSEVEVVVVEKEAFTPLLKEDSLLVRALSEALEARSRERARSDSAAAPESPLSVTDSGTFLLKIQRFFGLEG